MYPLHTAQSGEQIHIKCLECDCDNACRLRELGCVEGVKGKIISNSSNIVLQVGDTRLAISKKLARTILVNLD